MSAFTNHTGIAALLDRKNVDTDQIIPKQFLKRVEKTGYGEFLFFDWRFNNDGSPNPDFELNKEAFKGATILVTDDNFGCGSSREHAPWALLDYGFKVIIAQSYADIFYNNCFKNGILPIVLDAAIVDEFFQDVYANEGYQLTVNLEEQTITKPDGKKYEFEVDAFRKHCLLNGLDDIGLTLQHVGDIKAYEERRKKTAPWLFR